MRPGVFVSTNPDPAYILGDTDFDFENLYFGDFFGSQLSRFLDFQIPGCQLAQREGGAPVAGSSPAAPAVPNLGDPRNEVKTVRIPSVQAPFGE